MSTDFNTVKFYSLPRKLANNVKEILTHEIRNKECSRMYFPKKYRNHAVAELN
jgi:hypothetical protein